MQAFEGYFENGQFFPCGLMTKLQGRRRAIITILDEPVEKKATNKRLTVINEFFKTIQNSDEKVPEFERIKFNGGENDDLRA